MCGLAALLARPGVDVGSHVVAMCDAVRHRGPDGEGYALWYEPSTTARFFGGRDTPSACYGSGTPFAPEAAPGGEGPPPGARLALGHRRLSIVELSAAGHQPMADATGRCVVVFNGEIYNHVELRAELEALGHRFVSRSDTEVLLAAWTRWGEDCLPRFNGMFAFVLVDTERSVLFAARDRFGVKPLYWWVSPLGVLALASEIKQFTVLPGWSARLAPQPAYDFLNWGVMDHGPQTLFEGVRQLAGGECLRVALDPAAWGPLQPRRWYQLRAAESGLGFAEAADRLRELFEDSVRLRLRADVPVGTGLSGGLDSSSIVCTVNRLLRAQGAHARQQTFSACAEDGRFDERRFIEVVAGHTGVASHYVFPRLDELFERLDALVWQHDEPFASTSVYAEWQVFDLVRACGVKVTLDGHGADELLAGYHGFFGARLAGLVRRGDLQTLFREISAMRRRFGYGGAHLVLRLLDNLLPEALRQPLRRLARRAATGAVWLDARRLGVTESDPFRSRSAARDPGLRGLSEAQLLYTSLPFQLKWSDRDSMAHSVESRAPFLDYRLVEFVLGCPDEFKIEAGVTKRLLRQALADRLPPQVRDRVDKMGFVTPEAAWVREQAPGRFRSEVAAAVEASQGVLTPATLPAAEAIISGTSHYDNVLWRWICFGRWMRRFAVAA